MELYHLLMGMWLGMYVKIECGGVGILAKPILTVVSAYCVMVEADCLTKRDASCISQLETTYKPLAWVGDKNVQQPVYLKSRLRWIVK